MWWLMRQWLQSGGSIPDDPAFKQELATPIYWFDAQGRKVLEPKDEIKKRLQGGTSPDIADALALTFAEQQRRRTQREQHGYDPYAQMDRGYDPYAEPRP
jgi:hypothetical protein